jgi:hypothetical protein
MSTITSPLHYYISADINILQVVLIDIRHHLLVLILNLHIRLKILINTFRFHKIFNQ